MVERADAIACHFFSHTAAWQEMYDEHHGVGHFYEEQIPKK